MRPSEIIAAAAYKAGVDPQVAMKFARAKVEQEGYKLIRFDESIMLIKHLAPDVATAAFFSADNHIKMIYDMKHFKQMLVNQGIKHLYLFNQNEFVLNALNLLGIHVTKSNTSAYPLMAEIA
jgi:hypothetical protein